MSDPLITLTTDFGIASPYVAAMKGVILTHNPQARLIDLSHSIPPQDVRHAAFLLAAAIPHFPAETLHVVVVDPGVGTGRAILYAEADDQRVLAPDNGCLTLVLESWSVNVRQVTNRHFWQPGEVSNTFHGRDIFAPVAGLLSRGRDPSKLGPVVDNWVQLDWHPSVVGNEIRGQVLFVDDYGNLITNIRAKVEGTVVIGDVELTQRVRTYGDAPPGTLIALESSMRLLEIAEVQGSAARRLSAAIGTPVTVRRP